MPPEEFPSPPNFFFPLHLLIQNKQSNDGDGVVGWRKFRQSPFYASSIFIIICNQRNTIGTGTQNERKKLRRKKLLFILWLGLDLHAIQFMKHFFLGFFRVHSGQNSGGEWIIYKSLGVCGETGLDNGVVRGGLALFVYLRFVNRTITHLEEKETIDGNKIIKRKRVFLTKNMFLGFSIYKIF